MRAFVISRYYVLKETKQKAVPVPAYFDSTPLTTSHVHPHFVICNIALRMKKTSLEFFGPQSEIVESNMVMIETAMTLFDKWTRD